MRLSFFARIAATIRSFRAWLASEGGFNAKLLGASAAGVAVIVLLAIVFLMVTGGERRTNSLRDTTLAVLRVADKIENDLASLESTHRDYLFSGRAELLEQYKRRRIGLESRLDELASLVAGNSEQSNTLTRMRENIEHWETRFVEPQVAMRESGRDPSTLPTLEKSVAYAEGIRFGLAHFSRQQTDVVNDANERAARERLWETGGFGVLSLLAIGFFVATSGYSYRALKRHLRERKRYERDLADEKERLAVTLRSIGDGCMTIDNDGRILLMNPVAEKLTGWPHAEGVGRPLGEVFQLLNERTRRPCENAITGLIESGSAAEIIGPTVILARDGTERVIETNASPIRDTAERKVGVVLVFRDVTERHRIIEERQKAEKLESLGLAAGGIAHDFNNLLTAILGNLSLALFTPKLEPKTGERLTAAKKASLRAQELAQQLLTFAKGGAPIKQTASIAQLVRDTVGFSLRGSNVRGEFDIPDDLWPADVDAGQISQVVQNLTLNADQAMPAGGTVRVACANLELTTTNARLGLAPGRYLKIAVVDEGVGIPEEHMQKIFDPYFSTKPRGSGLGLATTYSIIKSHGGVIDVVSEPGKGSSFYLFLPASGEPPATAPAPAEFTPIEHRAARVLVLDDEEAICALVTCTLEPLGYEVVETYDATTAIRRYEEELRAGKRFDVVISDLTIPGGMGGQEAVLRLRAIDPTVKAIVSSGYAMDPVMAQFREHGFCAMIAKPYEIDALSRTVAEVLAAPAADNVIEHHFTARKTA